jgi:hypothetical protein
MFAKVLAAITAAVLSSPLEIRTSAQSAPAARHLLDLTSPNVLKTMPAVNWGHGIGRSGLPPPAPLPLELTMVALDRGAYEMGSPIVYDVQLTNIGDRPIGLPWSADLELVKQPARSFIESTLVLANYDAAGNVYQLGAAILAGSDSVRGSIETIRPGESALIRVGAGVIPPPDSRLPGMPSLSARAIYVLSAGPVKDWADLESINALPIEFLPPPVGNK